MSILLSDVVLPIIATVHTYLLEGKIDLWFGPRVTIQSIVSIFVEIALSDLFSKRTRRHREQSWYETGVRFIRYWSRLCVLFDDAKM